MFFRRTGVISVITQVKVDHTMYMYTDYPCITPQRYTKISNDTGASKSILVQDIVMFIIAKCEYGYGSLLKQIYIYTCINKFSASNNRNLVSEQLSEIHFQDQRKTYDRDIFFLYKDNFFFDRIWKLNKFQSSYFTTSTLD